MDAEGFVADVADRLSSLPGVRAVALGGSRARGTHRGDSDWDLNQLDEIVAGLSADPAALQLGVDQARELCAATVRAAG